MNIKKPQFHLILKIFVFVAELSAHESKAQRMFSAKIQNRCHRCPCRLPVRNQLHASVTSYSRYAGPWSRACQICAVVLRCRIGTRIRPSFPSPC